MLLWIRASHAYAAGRSCPRSLTAARTFVDLTARELPRFGYAPPRLALAGLNPHAGEQGIDAVGRDHLGKAAGPSDHQVVRQEHRDSVVRLREVAPEPWAEGEHLGVEDAIHLVLDR